MKQNLKLGLLAVAILAAGAAGAQTILGTGSIAQSGVAIGTFARQFDADMSFIGGPVYSGGIAIGNNTFASGSDVVIGDGLQASQDGMLTHKFVIGGFNNNTGTIDLRRIVGMQDGIFSTDGATLGQATTLSDQARTAAIMSSNNYTNSQIFPVLGRLGNVETAAGQARVTANAALASSTYAHARLDVVDTRLATNAAQLENHEVRITSLESMTGGFSSRISGLESRVDGLETKLDETAAIGAAMSAAVLPSLNPGETAMVAGVGASGSRSGFVVGVVTSNYASQIFSVKLGVGSSGTASIGAGMGFKF